jgi:VWFA-related protein
MCTNGTRVVLVACIGFSIAVIAQQQQVPSFKSTAQLVLVPAYVTRARQPVRGLSSEDFTLLNDGKQERISVFEEIAEGASAARASHQLAANSATNTASFEMRPTATILLLDFLDMTALGWERVHSRLADVARVFVERDEPVIVLVLSWNGLVQLLPVGSNPADFVQAAEEWRSSKNRQVPVNVRRVLHPKTPAQMAGMLDLYGVTPDHAPADVIDSRTQRFNTDVMVLAAVGQIAEAYKGLPGRKKLIWVSSDIPGYIKRGENRTSLNDSLSPRHVLALKALTDSNIAIYPVVANQLVASGGFDSCGSAISPDFYFIYQTGGSVCDDAPQVCVGRAVLDARDYYILGFYLHGHTPPGWHKLKVRVKDRKLDVRARQGFFITTEPSKNSVFESEAGFIAAAMTAPLDYTSIPLRMEWRTSHASGQPSDLELFVTAPLNVLSANGDPPQVSLSAVIGVTPTADGQNGSLGGTKAFSSSEVVVKERNRIGSDGLQYVRKFTVRPGEYDVRVLLRDNLSGKTGTVSARIDVP